MAKPLKGKVCLVTGATRGIGKGIALQLGGAGATVYITGRTLRANEGSIRGSLEETAKEVAERGGNCIPIQCDHAHETEVEAVFERIKREQNGRLDILVNNAFSAVHAITQVSQVPFWEQPIQMWDEVNNVGLRNHYVCIVHAAKLMVPAKQGLIVNISSIGAIRYHVNVLYGVGKAAVDKMAFDCAHELKEHNVTVVSLWPGAVRTEYVEDTFTDPDMIWDIGDVKVTQRELFSNGESTEFSGKAIVALFNDPNLLKKSGRILWTVELAEEYQFVDVDGRSPANFRRVRTLLKMYGHTWLAALVPSCIKIPFSILAVGMHRF
ncbi:dehydrogenase/reductase SDR family member 1-like [Diadema antillarum]|uniref:dehydrogenase/reductase SDR family member 1-like n=1 Tax=Diadema antillarum TaxID=105358 RepID=UPI003A868747